MKVVRAGVRVLLTTLFVVYVLLVVLAIFSDHLIFQPHAPSYDLRTLSLAVHGPVETFVISGEGGAMAAAYLPNPEARYTLLYSHGNGEDLGDDLPMLDEYRKAGFAVFAYDYNGYGQSAGKPSEAGVYRNSEAAFDFLTGSLHVPASRVISFGHSLGAAAIHLAASRPVAALIAQAPFLSAFRVVTRIRIVPWDKFNNARAIRQVHCPVLIAHGRLDEVVPFRQGERIFELAKPPKQKIWLDTARHNDVMVMASQTFVAAIQSFVSHLPA